MKYLQIVKHIQNEITNNHLKRGKKIPSIREMAALFNCSKATVIRAYSELETNHVLYSVPHSGYFVVNNHQYNPSNVDSIDFASMMPEPALIPYLEFRHCINQALDVYQEESLMYNDIQGLIDLRIALSKQLRNYQIFVQPENVYITAGAQQILDILVRMPFPNGKTTVLVEQPTYPGIINSLKIAGVTGIGIARNYNGIDFNRLETLFKNGNIKFFYTMPRYQNPLGTSYTRQEKALILDLARKYDVYIVEDDYLAEFNFDTKADPLYAMDDSDHVIYVKSYSKVCLPGLRIGTVLLPQPFKSVFLEYKCCVAPYTSSLLQGALSIFFQNGMYTNYVHKIRKFYDSRISMLTYACKDLPPDVKWQHSEHCAFILLEIPDKIDYALLSANLQMKNILIRGSDSWYLPNFEKKNSIRICIYQTDENKIAKGISVLIQEIKYWLNRK